MDDTGICKISDPVAQRSYIVKNRNFSGAVACDASYSWVLFSKRVMDTDISNNFFIYNPFTDEIIQLPRLKEDYSKATFSCSPTSPSCMVIALTILIGMKLGIRICQPGDKSWKMFESSGEHRYRRILDVAYAGGSFYCTFLDMKMGVFNVEHQEWKILSERLPIQLPCYLDLVITFNGDLLLLCVKSIAEVDRYWKCKSVQDTCFWRFDLLEKKWICVENKSMKNQVLFRKCTSFSVAGLYFNSFDYVTPSFSVPPIGNAKELAGMYLNKFDDYKPIKKNWIQSPFQSSSEILLLKDN